jgi:hypothetical protein
VRQHCGEHWREGVGVRLIDLELRPGDAAQSAAQAQRVEAWTATCHGAAGDAWAAALAALSDGQWADLGVRAEDLACAPWAARWREGSPTLSRVARALALAAVALEAAQAVGVVGPLTALSAWLSRWEAAHGEIPAAGVAERLLRWALGRVWEGRGASRSPSERLGAALLSSYHGDPGAWPAEEDYGARPGAVVGVLPSNAPGHTALVTAGGLQRLCRTHGVGERVWIAEALRRGWARTPSRADASGRLRVGGRLGRWVELDLAALQADLDDD